MNTDQKELIIQMQRFTASSISMLNLLQTACSRQQDSDIDEGSRRSKARFMDSSQKFIDNFRDQKSQDDEENEEEFDYTRFIKKAFTTLRSKEQCRQLVEKDVELFSLRDENNKIVTILPGLDLRFGFRFLDEKERVLFWQYMYLFSSSVFNMIKAGNESRFDKYVHIKETMETVEAEMAKTGIAFNNQVFNPFIGVGDSVQNYSVNEMFTEGELPKQHQVSIESVLSMLNINKIFDEQKLNDQLKNIGDNQINEATEHIVKLLDAGENPEIKEVCNMLIQDIVENFKENGISNIGETLRKVAQNAKTNITIDKMKRTAESMKHFMANSQEKIKDMKDENGNPIGQKMMNTMAVPLSMMNIGNNIGNSNNVTND